MGPAGPIGPAGPQGPSGAGGSLPDGSVIWVALGAPEPAGYEWIGVTTQEMRVLVKGRWRERHVTFHVYRKKDE